MKIHERIRKHMEKYGIVLNHVAKNAGIEEGRFYRLLSGRSKMTVDEYERICRDGLDVDPSFFFQRKFLEAKNKSA